MVASELLSLYLFCWSARCCFNALICHCHFAVRFIAGNTNARENSIHSPVILRQLRHSSMLKNKNEKRNRRNICCAVRWLILNSYNRVRKKYTSIECFEVMCAVVNGFAGCIKKTVYIGVCVCISVCA